MKYLRLSFLLCFAVFLFDSCDYPKDIVISQFSWEGTVDSFSPKSGQEGTVITIKGSIFTPNMPPDFEITINGVKLQNITLYDKEVRFTIPPNLTSGFIQLKIDGKNFQLAKKLFIWNKATMISGGYRSYPISFVINNIAYAGLGDFKTDFWQYNANTNTWTSKASPTNTSHSAKGCATDQKGYVLGNDDTYKQAIWEYTPSTNSWVKRAGFVNTTRDDYIATSANNKVYAGGGSSSGSDFQDWWEYNPATNVWTKKADLPGTVLEASAIGLGNKVYVIGMNSGESNYDYSFWEYNTVANTWSKKVDVPFLSYAPRYLATTNGKIYMLSENGNTGYLDEYDPATDKWIYPSFYTAGLNGVVRGVAFFIDNTFFYGHTSDNAISHYLWKLAL